MNQNRRHFQTIVSVLRRPLVWLAYTRSKNLSVRATLKLLARIFFTQDIVETRIFCNGIQELLEIWPMTGVVNKRRGGRQVNVCLNDERPFHIGIK